MPLSKQVLPAVIAINQEELNKMLEKIPFADNVMLDLMDGIFVEAKSLDFNMKLPEGPKYQLHIMAENPLKRVEKIPPEVDTVILHVETIPDIREAIKAVKKNELCIFIALNPETNIDIIEPYLEKIEGVLIMSVNPGQYGAKFLPNQLVKVRRLRELSEEINIEVDGGMNDSTIGLAIAAGANMIASGSFIMKSKDPKAAYNILSMFF